MMFTIGRIQLIGKFIAFITVVNQDWLIDWLIDWTTKVIWFSFSASSLQCYQCIREQGPDADKYCEISTSSLGNNSKVNCSGSDSRCIITKTILKDNSVKQFRRDCRTDEDCTNKCIADGDGVNVCHLCCDEDLCNKGNGPKAAEQSGTSRITMTRGLSALGGFLLWCLL